MYILYGAPPSDIHMLNGLLAAIANAAWNRYDVPEILLGKEGDTNRLLSDYFALTSWLVQDHDELYMVLYGEDVDAVMRLAMLS